MSFPLPGDALETTGDLLDRFVDSFLGSFSQRGLPESAQIAAKVRVTVAELETSGISGSGYPDGIQYFSTGGVIDPDINRHMGLFMAPSNPKALESDTASLAAFSSPQTR